MLDLGVTFFNPHQSGTTLQSFHEFCDINTLKKIIGQLFCRKFLSLGLSGIAF